MSEKNTNPEPEVPDFVKKVPELLPVWDWWVKEGRSTVLTLAIAGLAVAAFFGWRHWKKSESAKANAALVAMLSPEANIESQEEAVASYGSSKSGPMMRAVLAKAYYDDGRFEDALAAYEQLAKDADNASALADIARLGRAFSLEGIASQDADEKSQPAKYKTAAEAFAEYVNDPANTNSYLVLDAKIGAARCKALSGDKEGAKKDFDALTEKETSEAVKERIKNLTKSLVHFKQRAPAPLAQATPAVPAPSVLKAPAAPAKPETKAPAASTPAVPAKPAAPAKPEAKAPAAPAMPTASAKPAAPAPVSAKPATK